MKTWGTLLNSLDTPGGHVLLLLVLVGVGIGMSATQLPKAEDILIGSFGALLAMLRGVVKNGD